MTWRGMALPVRCEEPGWVSGRATAPDRPGADLTGGRDGAESEPGATCPVGGADPRQEWTVTPTGAELAELCKLPVRPGFWKRWKEAVPGRWRARQALRGEDGLRSAPLRAPGEDVTDCPLSSRAGVRLGLLETGRDGQDPEVEEG